MNYSRWRGPTPPSTATTRLDRDRGTPAVVQYGMRTLSLGTLVCLLVLTAPLALGEDEEPRPPRGRGGGGSMWDRLKAMDADGDGKLSREELEGRERLLDRLDTDGDGYITKVEAEAARGRRGGGRRQETPAPPTGLTLEMVDANRDGTISLGEWTELFATADCDGDGQVSAEEWKQLLAPVARPGGEAPAVGAKAPAVKAVPLAGGEAVDLAAPKRVTVLVFGSWT